MHSIAVIHNHPIHYKHLLFSAMKRIGLDFEVLFVSGRSSIRLEPLPLDQSAFACRMGDPGSYEHHPKWKTCRYIWSALNEIDPAVVIISGYYDVAGWTAWTWSILKGRRKILWNETNGFDSHRPWYKEVVKREYVKRFDFAHVYGISNKEYLMELGLPADRIVVKRAVTDTRHFRPQESAAKPVSGPLQMLFVGRLAPEKNLTLVLHALSGLRNNGEGQRLVFSIVGYGPQEQELKDLVERLGLNKVVRFEGAMKQSELPQRYGRADLFILPSKYEPWGLVALEAMLCGIPAMVSSQCGCARDLVSEATGWIFSPFDLPALVERLESVSQMTRAELLSMGKAASRAGSSYTPEACAAIVGDTIQACSAGPLQSRPGLT
jgi:glycosyltransferase involved in cell wall biosynthesis